MPNIDIGVIRQRIGRAQQIVTAAGTVPQIISKLPDTLTAATKANIVALTRQQELQELSIPSSLEEISNRLKEAQTSQNISTQLSNFKPFIAQSSVQSRRGTNSRVEGSGDGKNIGRSKGRRQVISPNALNLEISNRLKELTQLGIQKTQLLQQTELLEKQIAAISAKLQSLINTGASIETIRQYEAQLEKFSLLYDKTKVTLERIKKLYDARHEALEKLRKKRDELQESFWKNYDKVMGILKKFKEIPKKIKFPKLPKLPTLNVRKGNIKTKLMDVINKIKQASRDAAKTSIAKAKEESQEKISDPNKGDAFQKAASKARQALQTARQKAEFVQAQRDAIINATIGQVDNQLKRTRAGISKAQQQIEIGIDKAAAKTNSQLLKIAEAKQRAETLRDSQLAKLDSFAANLAQQAAAGITAAQNTLNKELMSADLKSSPNLSNRSVQELQKVDELKTNMTNFLNANNIKNFTTGIGIGSTLRSARQQSLTLDEFNSKYPEAVRQGRFDSTNKIGNVNGVYIVITTYYEKTGRPLVTPTTTSKTSVGSSVTNTTPETVSDTGTQTNTVTSTNMESTIDMVKKATPIITLASTQSGPVQTTKSTTIVTPKTTTTTTTTTTTDKSSGRKIVFVGDSITVGTAANIVGRKNSIVKNIEIGNSSVGGPVYLKVGNEKIMTAKVGERTSGIIAFASNINVQNADVAVLSAGSNDAPSGPGLDKLRTLRNAVKAKRCIWILPILQNSTGKVTVQTQVRTVAQEFGDRVVQYTGTVDKYGLHPTSYGPLANDVLSAIG